MLIRYQPMHFPGLNPLFTIAPTTFVLLKFKWMELKRMNWILRNKRPNVMIHRIEYTFLSVPFLHDKQVYTKCSTLCALLFYVDTEKCIRIWLLCSNLINKYTLILCSSIIDVTAHIERRERAHNENIIRFIPIVQIYLKRSTRKQLLWNEDKSSVQWK